MVQATSGDIILGCQMKTHIIWVIRVKLLHKTNSKRAQVTKWLAQQQQKDIIVPHTEEGHPLEENLSTRKLMGFQLISTFKPQEECDLGKAKKVESVKRLFSVSKSWANGYFSILAHH